MKKEIFLLVLPIAVACTSAEEPAALEDTVTTETATNASANEINSSQERAVENINTANATQYVTDANVIVLDVRTPEEQKSGVIGHPTCIDYNASDFEERVKAEVSKNNPVLVYCHAGGRSAKAAQRLIDMGYLRVLNLEEGMSAWQAEGHPISELK